MERFKLAVSKGEPVNPPIWWIAPEDKIAQAIDDEFLLGDKILVAPVIQEGKKYFLRSELAVFYYDERLTAFQFLPEMFDHKVFSFMQEKPLVTFIFLLAIGKTEIPVKHITPHRAFGFATTMLH